MYNSAFLCAGRGSGPYDRQDRTARTKSWHCSAIAEKVDSLLEDFLLLVPRELLDPERWKQNDGPFSYSYSEVVGVTMTTVCVSWDPFKKPIGADDTE